MKKFICLFVFFSIFIVNLYGQKDFDFTLFTTRVVSKVVVSVDSVTTSGEYTSFKSVSKKGDVLTIGLLEDPTSVSSYIITFVGISEREDDYPLLCYAVSGYGKGSTINGLITKIEIDPFTPRVFIYYPKHILVYD